MLSLPAINLHFLFGVFLHFITATDSWEDVKDSLVANSAQSSGMAAAAATDNPNYIPPTAPFSYSADKYGTVNLNTGAWTHEEIDLVLPGKNGLDLVMKRQWSSEDALGAVYSYVRNSEPLYILRYAYYRGSGYLDNNINNMHCYESNKIAKSDYSKYDWRDVNQSSPYAYNEELPFYSDQKEELLAYKSVFFQPQVSQIQHKQTGEWYDVYCKAEIVNIIANMGTNSSNVLVNYVDNLYRLGDGWSYAFSRIEMEYDYRYSTGRSEETYYLQLSDGRRYAWDQYNTDKNYSKLRGYEFEDMQLLKNSGGYTGASWVLTYADGKREYFNDNGYLLAIRDRFNNTITFEYTGQKIQITDTLDRVVTLENSATDANTRVLTGPDGFVKRLTKDINGNLASVLDENNDVTTYMYQNNNLSCNAFSPVSNEKNLNRLVYSLERATFPSQLSVYYGVDYASGYIFDGIGYQQRLFLWQKIANQKEGSKNVRINTDIYTSLGDYTGYGSTYLWGNYPYATSVESKYYYTTSVSTRMFETTHSYDASHQKKKEESVSYYSYFPYVWDSSLKLNKQVVQTKDYEHNNKGLVSDVTEKNYDYHAPNTYITKTQSYKYDNKGNLTYYKDPDGQITQMSFDTSYNLPLSKTYKKDANTEIKESYILTTDKRSIFKTEVLENNVVKQKMEYAYDTVGNVISETRFNGSGLIPCEAIVYSYADNQSRPKFNNAYLTKTTVTGILDASGSPATPSPGQSSGTIVTQAYYDTRGRLQKAVDAKGGETSYKYDAKGNVSKVTHPDGNFATASRNYIENTFESTDERGCATKYTYDQFGNLVEVKDMETEAVLVSYIYDKRQHVYEEKQYSSANTWRQTNYKYDLHDRVLESKTVDETGTLLAHETYVYTDAVDNQYQKVTKTVKGEAGSPDIITVQYTDKMGRVSKEGIVIGGTEMLTEYTYDYVGNRLTAKNALNQTTSWTYDYAGRVTEETNAVNKTAKSEYDALGRKTSFTDFAGSVSSYTYDNLGRLLEEKIPFEKDASNPPVYTYKQYTYDPAGNVTHTRQTNNQPGETASWGQIEYGYNNRGFLDYTFSEGVYTVYKYDEAGNMTEQYTGQSSAIPVTDAPHTAYAYDHFGQVETITDALGQEEEYQYDLAGNLTFKTDRNGAVSENHYDSLGRLRTSTVTKDGQTTGDVSFDYYLTGQKKSESNDTNTLTFTYFETGLLHTESESGGVVKTYGYDVLGSRTSYLLTVGGVTQVNTGYTYDAMNRMQTVKENGVLQATYVYDDNGNRKSLTYNANGTSEVYDYNLANLVTSVTNKKGVNTLSKYEYSYYLDGNQRTKKDHNNVTTTYVYDGLGRLKSENVSSGTHYAYEYDKNSNRKKMTVQGPENYTTDYEYDANNRLLSTVKTNTNTGDTETDTYAYDANGNQVSRVRETLSQTPAAPAPAPSLGFGGDFELSMYDGFNRLVTVISGGQRTEYDYNPNGLRHSKSVNGILARHVWDGTNISADIAGSTINKYIRGINLLTSDGKYYLYNAHGDVIQLVDGNGVVTKTYAYDAFGVEQGVDPDDTNPWRYCAEYFDKETGQIYLRARYYDPLIGRMISEDTVRGAPKDPLSLNLYTYCWNNPILYIDSTGNWPTLKDITRTVARWLIANPAAVYATQQGWFSDVFYAAGFVRDSGGVYHARPDAIQQVGGYNDFYDIVFDYATSMDKAKFQFTSGDREYMFWAWKGDYLNLGAGAELGIYSNKSGILGKVDVTSPLDSHWLVDTSLAMTMTMTLQYKGETIINYNPSEKQWWITGFNPYKQNVLASDLTAIYTAKFNSQTMYNDFYNIYGKGDTKDTRWTFDSNTMTATFGF